MCIRDSDNAGLQVGLTEAEATGALLCLDVTEAVVDEAVMLGYLSLIHICIEDNLGSGQWGEVTEKAKTTLVPPVTIHLPGVRLSSSASKGRQRIVALVSVSYTHLM